LDGTRLYFSGFAVPIEAPGASPGVHFVSVFGGPLVTVVRDEPGTRASDFVGSDGTFYWTPGGEIHSSGRDGPSSHLIGLAALPPDVVVGPGQLRASLDSFHVYFGRWLTSAHGDTFTQLVVVDRARETLSTADTSDLGVPMLERPIADGDPAGALYGLSSESPEKRFGPVMRLKKPDLRASVALAGSYADILAVDKEEIFVVRAAPDGSLVRALLVTGAQTVLGVAPGANSMIKDHDFVYVATTGGIRAYRQPLTEVFTVVPGTESREVRALAADASCIYYWTRSVDSSGWSLMRIPRLRSK
jgi:hypothetical protein